MFQMHSQVDYDVLQATINWIALTFSGFDCKCKQPHLASYWHHVATYSITVSANMVSAKAVSVLPCVYVYMCIYIYICIHTLVIYAHIYIYIYIYIYITHVYVYMYPRRIMKGLASKYSLFMPYKESGYRTPGLRTRFPSFRTQPLENLSRYLWKRHIWATQPLAKIF